ncbi:hypothetical protein ILUMI_24968 [Ignelater luminosus]|uniref:Lipase domain-containing protein n=1 Tax=Ignelater luminosus TaxID=2038154 RepID=A0A8K0G0D8_IGNLU|nr:hypothetical protein ILUMI_24968 [Ignelater luminosus]
MNTLTRGMKPPVIDSCIPRVITIAGIYKVALSERPFGYCHYCCSPENPADHLTLYLTSKEKQGIFTRLETIKKQGLFKSAGFKRNLLTIIYIPGFVEDGRGFSATRILEAYLNRTEDYNIILVDWKNFSAAPWYMHAANNTKIVGDTLATTLKFHNRTGEVDLSKVHLIGLSIGAHIAGFLGKHFKGRHKIGRITGLDPAFSLFPLKDRSRRLSRFDADFVDVIHTNAGMIGFPISLGHADFYPNGGGIVQPGCELPNLIENKLSHLTGFCSHFLSNEFYIESVRNPTAFPATKCDSIAKNNSGTCRFVIDGYMGFSANKSYFGDFYLATRFGASVMKSLGELEASMMAIN